jgi:general secretion pathway protein G
MKRSRPEPRRVRRDGFTLMEVLLVLAILGVIAAMVVPQLIGRQQQSMIETTRTSLRGIESGLQMYARDNKGQFPEGGDDVLRQLTVRQDINNDGTLDGPWLESYRDAWGNPFHYEWPNTKDPTAIKPAVWSDGPTSNPNDDIVNWNKEGSGI